MNAGPYWVASTWRSWVVPGTHYYAEDLCYCFRLSQLSHICALVAQRMELLLNRWSVVSVLVIKTFFFFLTVCFLFCRFRSCWRTMCLQPEGSQDGVWEFVCLTLPLLVTLRFSSELSINSLWWSFVRNTCFYVFILKLDLKEIKWSSSSLEEGRSLAISVVAIFAYENIQYQRKHLSKDKENQLAWNDLMMKDLRNLSFPAFFNWNWCVCGLDLCWLTPWLLPSGA